MTKAEIIKMVVGTAAAGVLAAFGAYGAIYSQVATLSTKLEGAQSQIQDSKVALAEMKALTAQIAATNAEISTLKVRLDGLLEKAQDIKQLASDLNSERIKISAHSETLRNLELQAKQFAEDARSLNLAVKQYGGFPQAVQSFQENIARLNQEITQLRNNGKP
jgi:chromosome segregation ATPase